jgi:hypothetical protein
MQADAESNYPGFQRNSQQVFENFLAVVDATR